MDGYGRLSHELYELETVVLRHFNVYWERQRGGDYSGVIGIFLEQARNGDPITVHGDGTQTRDFVHVADVMQANLSATTTDGFGKAFNIGTGSSASVIELAETVQEVIGGSSEIVHTDPREGDVERSCADTSTVEVRLRYERRRP